MMEPLNKQATIEQTARAAAEAATHVAVISTESKNEVLSLLAARLEHDRRIIFKANAEDMSKSREAGLGEAKLRRLELTEAGIDQMAEGLRQVVALPDPVGQVTKEYEAPNGLLVRKIRAPIGVVAMIYEARPNVTVDAFALCFKAGNACLLKGGREAAQSNEALAQIISDILLSRQIPATAITALTATSREDIRTLLTLDQYIDLVIPRGGSELIRFVHEHSRIPTVQHFHGVCHIFVDESADVDKALKICTSAKTSAPAACNAAEAILIHRSIANDFVPKLVDAYTAENVEVRGDEAVCRLATAAKAANSDDWGKEFLDLIVAVRVVDDLEAAIAHIHRYGSNHTEVIISENVENQRAFQERVQSSCVLVNASTRFNDGFQLGLGAEIGISTSKIHAYGPMGLEELTTQRYVANGDGQWR